nr:uncharacterized protein LOC104651492 [Saimiri boliviensis boliviensis]
MLSTVNSLEGPLLLAFFSTSSTLSTTTRVESKARERRKRDSTTDGAEGGSALKTGAGEIPGFCGWQHPQPRQQPVHPRLSRRLGRHRSPGNRRSFRSRSHASPGVSARTPPRCSFWERRAPGKGQRHAEELHLKATRAQRGQGERPTACEAPCGSRRSMPGVVGARTAFWEALGVRGRSRALRARRWAPVFPGVSRAGGRCGAESVATGHRRGVVATTARRDRPSWGRVCAGVARLPVAPTPRWALMGLPGRPGEVQLLPQRDSGDTWRRKSEGGTRPGTHALPVPRGGPRPEGVSTGRDLPRADSSPEARRRRSGKALPVGNGASSVAPGFSSRGHRRSPKRNC